MGKQVLSIPTKIEDVSFEDIFDVDNFKWQEQVRKLQAKRRKNLIREVRGRSIHAHH